MITHELLSLHQINREQLPLTPDANYEISNISLEYEIVTQPSLANRVRSQYMEMTPLYSRVLRHRRIMVDKQTLLGTGTLIHQ